jgi:tetratricopeptide (TPR) repeat protein
MLRYSILDRPLLATVILSGALLTAGCGGAKSRLESHIQRGQAYLARGDLPKANVEFRNAMQIAPKDDRARLLVGETAEQMGKTRDALVLYQAVVDSSPQNAQASADLSRILILAGASPAALKILQPALIKHPQDAALLALRAGAEIIVNEPAKARTDVEQALKLASTNEEAIQVRARLYRKDNDLPGAIVFVGHAVDQSPQSKTLRQVLVDLYISAKQPQQAEKQLRELVRLSSQDVSPRYELANFLARNGRADDAQRVLEDAATAFPKDVQVKLVLVEFVSTSRTRAQGEQLLRGYIAKDPDNFDLQLGLGQLLQRSAAVVEASKVYQAIVAKDANSPASFIARDRLAAIAFSQGHYAEAQQQIDAVLKTNPRDMDALLLRGQIALSRSDATSAIADLRAVLREKPQSVPLRKLLASAYVKNGEPSLAEESLRAAMDMAPKDIDVRVELARLFMQTKRPDQAISLLEGADNSAKPTPVVLDTLARAFLDKHDYPRALEEAEQLQQALPRSADGFYLGGMASQGLKRNPEARKQFEQALALHADAMDALSSLAHLDLAEGHPAQAIALVKNSTQIGTPNAFAFNLLCELYLIQGDVASATAALRKAIELMPSWWVPYRSLAAARQTNHDTQGAIAAFQAGIEAVPTQPELVSGLAFLYEHEGHVDEAIAAYEAWNRRQPGNISIANNLAMLLVTYKTDRSSLDRARDLTAGFVSSADGSLLDTNGCVHFKRAEYAQALTVLEQAVQRAPQTREIRYHLGMVELHQGLKERARSDLEAAIAGPGSFAGVKDARIALASLSGRAG